MPLGEEVVSPMKFLRLTAFAVFFIFAGCSTSAINNSTLPDNDVPGLPSTEASSNRTILAIGTIQFDPGTLDATFLPDREAAAHWNVTPMLMPPNCDGCILIEVSEFKPAEKFVKLKVHLLNPTQFTGYDVRGIVMTNDPGVRLLNADAYTTLWDDGGAVTKNPFRPFAYEVPGRIFYPYTVHSHTYDFTYKNLSGLAGAKFVVDASWPGHCLEAWDIREQEASGDLAPDPASSVLVTCVVKDWQSDWAGVELDLSSLGFPVKIPMNGSGGTYWAFVFNQFSASPGDYRIWFEAIDSKTNVRLYDDLIVTVAAAEMPSGFKLKPGETFVEASWDWPELSAYVSEYHLFKREKGGEFDYGNPIHVLPTQAVYLDEDVLAGHMYFYKLSAKYELGESELTEEHGAKPFKWGPIVQVSDSPGIDMYPEISRGWDGSVWVGWDFGFVENLDDPMTPDWNVTDHGAHLPGPKNPSIAVDGDGYVHIEGMDLTIDGSIRYMKCNPYDGGVLQDIYVAEKVQANTGQISVTPDGVAYIVYTDGPPEWPSGEQVYYQTVDPDGVVSEPVQVSLGYVNGQHLYLCTRPTVHVGVSGTVHFAWLRNPLEGPGGWTYRALTNGEFGPEETTGTGAVNAPGTSLWEDMSGVVHFCEGGRIYYYRAAGAWSQPIKVNQTTPLFWNEGGGWVGGDDDNDIFFIWSWQQYAEVTYRQHYNFDWSDEYKLTTGHGEPYGPAAAGGRIAADKYGLAVAVWYDEYPNWSWGIFMRRQVME